MIFPAGHRKNKDEIFNPLEDRVEVSPHSRDYVPELKKNVKKAARTDIEEANGVQDPRSIDYQPQMKNGPRAKHEWAQVPQKQASFIDIANNVLGNAHSIGSARAGLLTDVGGTVRQMQTRTANSIWDANVVERMKKGEGEFTKGEQIKADNKKLSESREQAHKKNFYINLDDVKKAQARGDLAKGCSISGQNSYAEDGSNYSNKVTQSQLSLFDSPDKFEEMPALTAGEQLKKANAERRDAKKKDRSWAKASGVQSTRQQLSDFFNGLKTEGK